MRRSAITMIEVIVVIGVIAVIVAMIIPAIQKARAGSLALVCKNNARQLGVALHLYHTDYGSLPSGTLSKSNRIGMPQAGWGLLLLPYLEQDGLWRQAQQSFKQNMVFYMDPPHSVRTVVLPVFSCPVDDEIRSANSIDRPGLSSYLGVSGTDSMKRDGMLFLDSAIRLNQVPDGLSHTLLLGERPPGDYYNNRPIRGRWYAGWGQNNDGSTMTTLGVREIKYEPGDYCSPGPYHFQYADRMNPCSVYQYFSLHPSGGHFLTADGSVHFYRYTIDPLLPALATRSGGEPTQELE